MHDTQFDASLIASAFDIAAKRGWRHVSVAEAARAAGLPLPRARRRFPGRAAILLRFGQAADAAALDSAADVGPVKDRLFDMLMRRIDVLQAHRAGVLALLRALPALPGAALLLEVATRRSMRWLLEAAGLDASGLNGLLHVRGLEAVWLWTVRAWARDESADLGTTMATLDQALQRAGEVSQWLPSPLPGTVPTRESAPTTDLALSPEPIGPPADKVSDANGSVSPG